LKRRPSPPPIVEVKKSRGSAASPPAVRRATPDRTIRAWNPDDKEKREEEAFLRKPTPQQLDEIITAWCAMYRRPNDPDVEKRIAWRSVGSDLMLAALRNCRLIENKKGEEIAILYPHKGGWGQLRQGLHMQLPPEKFIQTERSAPQPWKRTSWWQYIRDLRKRTKP
jgi:hypothetical protein